MDVSPKGTPGYAIFPNHPNYSWNEDNFGPIYLPQSGAIVSLNEETLPLYKRIIEVYENHDLKIEDNRVYIDGIAADSYQFEKNYYWMMGDNRDHSEDSRSWGYVPEDHILGKPVFLWMSWDNFNKGITKMKPRWDRFFTTVQGPGEPQSYLSVFLIGLAGYFGYRYWRKRKMR
ncbi:MAG: signal peptidase I [Flavobacteriaceae bacterium]